MRIMRETVWHPSQTFQKLSDGALIMILNVTDTHELVSWILGWGDKVKVLEPKKLRMEVIQTAKSIQSIYTE